MFLKKEKIPYYLKITYVYYCILSKFRRHSNSWILTHILRAVDPDIASRMHGVGWIQI